MRRVIAFILTALMLVTLLVGCVDEKEPDDIQQTDPATDDTTAADISDETSGNYDENGYILDNLPGDIDMKNKKLTFLYWEDSENPEFFAEGQTGELVNDAIYYRNLKVEERLKLELAFVGSPGKYEEQTTFITKAQNDITSGLCEYDVLAAYSMTIATTAYKGLAIDLMQFDDLDFDMPWWPDNLLDESTIYDKLYFASGDISTNMLNMMYCCFFNKNMLTTYDLKSPYDLVESNEWTLDKMIEMSENIYQDNGDNIKNAGDTFAFSVSSSVHYDPFYYGAGLRTMTKQEDGTPMVSPDMSSEKAVDLVNKVRAYLNDGNYSISDDNTFIEGRALFRYDRVQIASKKLKDVDYEFGIVPVPKYDSAQENYSTVLGFPYTLYCISAGSKNNEDAATMLECMASESYRQITPVLFEECMKVKYANDDQTSRMYDILRETVNFDIGRIFTMSFDKITFQVFRNSVSSTGSNDYSTTMRVYVKTLNKLVEKFADTFSAMN